MVFSIFTGLYKLSLTLEHVYLAKQKCPQRMEPMTYLSSPFMWLLLVLASASPLLCSLPNGRLKRWLSACPTHAFTS